MRVYEERRGPADEDTEHAPEHGDETGLDDYRLNHRRARNPHQPERRDVAAALVYLEHHDAEQEDRARDDRDQADRPMEAADDEERSRCLDGDVARPIRPESECLAIHLVEHATDVAGVGRGDGEAIDAVPISRNPLQLIEMQSGPEIAARDLGRVGAALEDRSDDYGLTGGGIAPRTC